MGLHVLLHVIPDYRATGTTLGIYWQHWKLASDKHKNARQSLIFMDQSLDPFLFSFLLTLVIVMCAFQETQRVLSCLGAKFNLTESFSTYLYLGMLSLKLNFSLRSLNCLLCMIMFCLLTGWLHSWRTLCPSHKMSTSLFYKTRPIPFTPFRYVIPFLLGPSSLGNKNRIRYLETIFIGKVFNMHRQPPKSLNMHRHLLNLSKIKESFKR